jgi:hypothetical protein
MFLLTIAGGLANATGTSIAFVTKADTLTGIVQHYDANNNLVDQELVSPQAQVTTDTYGSATESIPIESGTALGIRIYDIVRGENGTSGCNTVNGCDQTSANTSARTIDLLEGLVVITHQATSLVGVADPDNPRQVDITEASASASSVRVSGVSVPPGTYLAGTIFPVSGPVAVPVIDANGNPTPVMHEEAFTGELVVAQIWQGTDSETGASVFAFASERLSGKVPDGAGGHYQITLGGPQTPPLAKNSAGPSFVFRVQPTFRVAD